MREAANRLCETMNGLSWREPELPVVQNVDAEVHDGLQSIRDAQVRQLYLPVQWTGVVQALASTELGRASCRERGCTYVEITVVAVALKKTNPHKLIHR